MFLWERVFAFARDEGRYRWLFGSESVGVLCTSRRKMKDDLTWNPFYACVLFARQLDLAVKKRIRLLERALFIQWFRTIVVITSRRFIRALKNCLLRCCVMYQENSRGNILAFHKININMNAWIAIQETDVLFERIEIEIEVLKENIIGGVKCHSPKIHTWCKSWNVLRLFLFLTQAKVTDTNSFEW